MGGKWDEGLASFKAYAASRRIIVKFDLGLVEYDVIDKFDEQGGLKTPRDVSLWLVRLAWNTRYPPPKIGPDGRSVVEGEGAKNDTEIKVAARVQREIIRCSNDKDGKDAVISLDVPGFEWLIGIFKWWRDNKGLQGSQIFYWDAMFSALEAALVKAKEAKAQEVRDEKTAKKTEKSVGEKSKIRETAG